MRLLLIISASILFLSSCEKVIQIDVKDSDKRVVIQANYSATEGEFQMSITKTAGYFSGENQEKVNSATVTLTAPNGTSHIVPSIGNGNYSLSGLTGGNGNYTLEVAVDGILYSSTSTLTSMVQLDPISTEIVPNDDIDPLGGGNEPAEGLIAFINYQDPVNEVNFYRIEVEVNGELERSYSTNDKFSNGQFISEGSTWFLDIGDHVIMRLQSISENTHDYYEELNSLNDSESAAPANPKYQWTNKALGYFSAFHTSEEEIIIQ